MIRRSTILVFEIVLGILALLAIPAAVLLWRLASGPVEVDFLTPYIEEAFQESTPNSKVEVGATVLEWQGLSRSIDLRARDIRFLDLDDDLALALPEVSVKLSVRALLRGVIAPPVIKIRDAYLYLVRQEDGTILLEYATEAPSDGADPGGQVGAALPDFLNRLVPDPDPDQPLTLLNEVRVENSTVFILDEKANRTWRLPLERLALYRDELGLNGDLAVTLGTGTMAPRLEAAFLYDKETEILDLSAGFKDLAPSDLAAAFEALTPLEVLRLPLAGNISTAMDPSGKFSAVSFTLEGGMGSVDLSAVARPDLEVREFSASGRLDHEAGTLEIMPARLALGNREAAGPSLEMAASVVPDSAQADRYLVATNVALAGLPFNDLENYWPEDMGEDARPWVTGNLRDGIADRLAFQANLAVSLPAETAEETPEKAPEEAQEGGQTADGQGAQAEELEDGAFAVELQSLEGDFAFHDVSLHYFRPLPPATKVAGQATFNRDGLDVTFTAGEVGAIKLAEGAVKISGLMLKEGQLDTFEEIWIDAIAQGPAEAALTLLNHEELDLLSDLGISPEGSAGEARTRLSFYFPLKKSLTVADVEVSALSAVEGLKLRELALGQDVTDGQVQLEINGQGMRVTGTAAVAGAPFEIDWSEAFDGAADYRTHLRAVTKHLNDESREALGLDFGGVMTGPLAATIFLTLQEDGQGEAKIAANLQEVAIDLPAINWDKPAGSPGEAHIAVKLQDLDPVSYDTITLRAGDLLAEGRAQPAAEGGGFESLSLDRLVFAGGDLQGVELKLAQDPIDIAIAGGRINAAHFKDEAEDEAVDEAAAPQDGEAESGVAATPFALRAPQLAAVDFGKERRLHKVSLELEQDAGGWRRIFLYGEIPQDHWTPDRFFVSETAEVSVGGLAGRDGESEAPAVESELAAESEAPQHRQVLIDLAPTSENGRSLKVETNDFGAAMRAMDVLDTIRGGKMNLTGSSPGPIGDSRLTARIEAEDFFIVDAPVMARLFTVASLTGGVELLTNEGLYMRQMVGDFTVEDWLAESDLIRVYGNAVGLTAQGSVDLDDDKIDLRGTLVPAYTINRLLGGIPLLGRLLVGGEGEGILAITYDVKGSMLDPEISVNPLSVLAPGFLRGLFTGSADDEGEEPRAFPQQLENRNKLQ